MRAGVVIACCLAGVTSVASAAPSLTVTPTANTGALVLDGQGTSTTRVVKVADISLSTLALGGLTLSITSGGLTKPGGAPIPFQVLLVNNLAPAPSAAAFTTPSGTTFTWSSLTLGVFEKDLYIKYTPAPLQDPGTYTASFDLAVVE